MTSLQTVLSLSILLAAISFYFYLPTMESVVQLAGGYSAKFTCSGVFLSGREFRTISDHELSNIARFLVQPTIDYAQKSVTAYLFGSSYWTKLLGLTTPIAQYLGPELGCVLFLDQAKHNAGLIQNIKYQSISNSFASERKARRNCSDFKVHLNTCLQNVLQHEFSQAAFERNHSRAVVVLHDGVIIGEQYQSRLGINEHTRLLGWSMSKSVHAIIIGAAIQHNIVTLDTPVQLEYLQHAGEHYQQLIRQNDNKPLSIRQLLQMADVLQMEEIYTLFSDVVKMLFDSDNAAQFASSVSKKPLESRPRPFLSEHGECDADQSNFGWYYSSGLTNVLAHELQQHFLTRQHTLLDYLHFLHRQLFGRIGAHSFATEIDNTGTFTASSFMFATARDWARVGELLRNNGRFYDAFHLTWRQIIPADFVSFLHTPYYASSGHYGGSFWLNPSRVSVKNYNLLPSNHPEKVKRTWLFRTCPRDAYLMSGHDGQHVMIIPSRKLVVVRLGFSKSGSWDVEQFFDSILSCIGER